MLNMRAEDILDNVLILDMPYGYGLFIKNKEGKWKSIWSLDEKTIPLELRKVAHRFCFPEDFKKLEKEKFGPIPDKYEDQVIKELEEDFLEGLEVEE